MSRGGNLDPTQLAESLQQARDARVAARLAATDVPRPVDPALLCKAVKVFFNLFFVISYN